MAESELVSEFATFEDVAHALCDRYSPEPWLMVFLSDWEEERFALATNQTCPKRLEGLGKMVCAFARKLTEQKPQCGDCEDPDDCEDG